MTTSIKARVEAASKKRRAASDAIFSFAKHPQMRWSECFEIADANAKEAFEAADDALLEAERSAIAKGKAYRASFGLLIFYA